MTIKLSAAIITYNEEANIKRCIESLMPIADDIVVVDSFSKDNTIAIAERAGARVVQHPFVGHIEQKNYAITQCMYPHIISLDADEELTPILQESILKVKNNWQHDGYLLNRCTYYCGRWIKHGAWYPDWHLRMWDSRKGKWGGQNPHDKYLLPEDTKTLRLMGDILHYSYNSISEHLLQMDKFTDIASKQMFAKKKNITFAMVVFKLHFHFIQDYIFKMGFLDGWQGYTLAKLSSIERLVRYSKLMDLYRIKRNA